MKDQQYDPSLPHGLEGEAYRLANKYDLAEPWTSVHGVFDDVPILPEGLLNEKGLTLLKDARKNKWDHRHFFYYKRLGINWIQLSAMEHLIYSMGISDNPTDRDEPNAANAYFSGRDPGFFEQAKTAEEKILSPWDTNYRSATQITTVLPSLIFHSPPIEPGRNSRLDSYSLYSSLFGGWTWQIDSMYEKIHIGLNSLSTTPLTKTLLSEVITEEIRNKFSDVLSKHGLFTGHYYGKYLSKYVTRELVSARLEDTELSQLYAETYGIPPTYNMMHRLISHIFWILFHETIQSDYWAGAIDNWITEFSEPRNCHNCDETFSPINLRAEFYYGSNANTTLCFGCFGPGKPLEKDLDKLITEFVSICGFPPPDGTTPIDPRVTSHIPHSDQAELFNAWARMGGIDHVKTVTGGSWFKAMHNAGCIPESYIPMARGYKCIANDGCECLSLDEKLIDDWMSENNISHYKEPNYPQHREYNDSGLKRADWMVGETFVEYFGLAGNDSYDKRTLEKMKLCRDLGLELVPIYPEDVQDLDSLLLGKLN
tara:strand:+ start:1895 stop:3514 length:1620 start_codon:yes stop_codon:yes gene_type:complete